MIVPWTSPNGEPCCCCNEEQPSTYSPVTLSSAAYNILRVASSASAVLQAGVSFDYQSNGDYGAKARITGTQAVQSTTLTNGTCATSSSTPTTIFTTNSVNCSRTDPIRAGFTYTLASQSCIRILGGIGKYEHRLAQSNIAYINMGASFTGVVSYSWSGVDENGASAPNISTSVTYQIAFATQNAGTNGNIALVIGGESFNLPVIYFTLVSSVPAGSANPSIGTWLSGTPLLTYTIGAP